MPNVKIRVESVSNDELEAQKQGQEVSGKQTTEKLAVASIFAHQAINTTKQIVNYGISNIGNFTGDYIKQDRVQEVVNGIGDAVSVGIAFATSPIAGAIAVLGIATKKTFEVITENQNVKHAENQANYLRQRSGNSTQNGSR